MTPEGKVKDKLSKMLVSIGCVPAGKVDKITPESEGWFWMPVPGGYGVSFLDYIGFFRNRPFAIEAKKPGKDPTPLQQLQIDAWEKLGAMVWVVRCDEDIERVRKELTNL